MPKVSVPEPNHKLNYLFDTCAISKIAGDDNHTKRLIDSLSHGFRYYKTDCQDRELRGVPDRSLRYWDESAWKSCEEMNKALNLLDKVKAERVSCIATLLHNFTILDGSMREPPSKGSGLLSDMVDEIIKGNYKNIRDAVTAEAAVHNNCRLITSDQRMYRIVNRHFPKNIYKYNEFISKLYSF